MSSSDKSPQKGIELGVRLFLLNQTPLGKFYQRYLKRFKIIRGLVILSWKFMLRISIPFYYRFSNQVLRLPLQSLADAASVITVIASPQEVVTPAPFIFPARKAKRCPSPHATFVFPGLYLARLQNQVILGRSNFLVGPDAVVHHDLFRLAYDYTSEELHGRMVVKPKTGQAFLLANETKGELAEAAAFTDAVASNYAHFLTEILPRLHFFVCHAPAHVPLIIDAGLHDNLLAAIRLVVGEERPLIQLDIGQAIRVKNLWVSSVCGYVPFERRPGTGRLPGHFQGMFSPLALCSMRDAITTSLRISVGEPIYRKIFIRRNSGYRNVSNAIEIERRLVGLGFEVVEPETLSFAQQVVLFSSASVVVGATGAAFANLVFCDPACRLIIMIAELKGTSYYYWQNIASASGGQVTYVLGEIPSRYFRSIHSDFYVSPDDVIAAVRADCKTCEPSMVGGR